MKAMLCIFYDTTVLYKGKHGNPLSQQSNTREQANVLLQL